MTKIGKFRIDRVVLRDAAGLSQQVVLWDRQMHDRDQEALDRVIEAHKKRRRALAEATARSAAERRVSPELVSEFRRAVIEAHGRSPAQSWTDVCMRVGRKYKRDGRTVRRKTQDLRW